MISAIEEYWLHQVFTWFLLKIFIYCL